MNETINHYRYLPFVLSVDPFVIEATQGRRLDAISPRLEMYQRTARVDEIFLLDRTGLTIAASNWRLPTSFVGQNYGYRPYFQDALAHDQGEFFAIGVQTRMPGYFISRAVRDFAGRISGVIVVKVSLDGIEQAWQQGGEQVLVVNADGVIVLSSERPWRYRTLKPLDHATRSRITALRQFADEPLEPLGYDVTGGQLVATIEERTFIHHVTDLGQVDWQLHFLRPYERATARTFLALAIASSLLLVLVTAFLFVRSRRIATALRASQESHRALRLLYHNLQKEIEERRLAEEERRVAEAALETTRTELKLASNLATLGRLAASVSHELSQPLAAMKAYIASGLLPGDTPGDTMRTFARLDGLVDRMNRVTRQLKSFGRKGEDRFVDVDLRKVMLNVLELLQSQIDQRGIQLDVNVPTARVVVRGDAIRLDQVLVNIVSNAMEALDNQAERRISLVLQAAAGLARMTIADNGPGIDANIAGQVFEPFFTTKASGKGTGLGLAISASIINDLNGRLMVDNAQDGGAVFVVELPLAQHTEGVSAA